VTKEELFEAVKALPPEEKIELFKALRMSRIGEDHQPDCLCFHGGDCGCIPPASMWTHPRDVAVYLKETDDDLRDQAEKRQRVLEARRNR
jgi:hypothetical protein